MAKNGADSVAGGKAGITPKKPAVPKRPVGRPSLFNQTIAGDICGRIAAGESLRSICKDEKMPDQVTIYRWLAVNEEFRKLYVQAREDQAETHADVIVDIADADPELEPVTDREGNVVEMRIHSAYVAYQKNRIDARKWVAAKLKPRKYGDKVDLNHGGQVDNPLHVLMEQVTGTKFKVKP